MKTMDTRVDAFSFVGQDDVLDLRIDDFPSWTDPAGGDIGMCWCFTGAIADGSAA